MQEKLVSVIVPAYNGEKHLAATLESIINQDYKNLEIIFVNDASTDNTLNIAEKILKNSKRDFKIINHKKNSGVSTARNAGLDASGGEYICFCDGDDLLKKNFISALMNEILKDESDISFCGSLDRFEDGRADELHCVDIKESSPLGGEQALYMRIFKPIAPVLCSIIFRKSMIIKNQIRFHDGCTAFEDIEFELKAFCHAQKVSFINDCLYIYNLGSNMGSIRYNDTEGKKLRRYIHSSQAHERAAEYLSLHAPSERVKFWADNMLMPEAIIRKFTIEARKNDKTAYKNLCNDKKIREVLRRSWKILFRKPELFFKSLMLLYVPKLYYFLRK